jgi:hypothetical protein
MSGGLPSGEANNAGLNSLLMIPAQNTPKSTGFIIRVRGDTHHSKHDLIVSRPLLAPFDAPGLCKRYIPRKDRRNSSIEERVELE